jgi:hypothetical protein
MRGVLAIAIPIILLIITVIEDIPVCTAQQQKRTPRNLSQRQSLSNCLNKRLVAKHANLIDE